MRSCLISVGSDKNVPFTSLYTVSLKPPLNPVTCRQSSTCACYLCKVTSRIADVCCVNIVLSCGCAWPQAPDTRGQTVIVSDEQLFHRQAKGKLPKSHFEMSKMSCWHDELAPFADLLFPFQHCRSFDIFSRHLQMSVLLC